MKDKPGAYSIGSPSRWGYVAALLAVATVTGVIAIVIGRTHLANISMLYLIAVIALAVRYGLGPAILASVSAFVLFDFFFTRPYYTFTVSDPAEWLTLLLFLFTAIITGQLAARQRQRAEEAEARERDAAILYDVARILGDPDSQAALKAVAERLQHELDLAAIVVDIDPRVDELSEAGVEFGEREALRAVRGAALAPVQLLTEGTGPTATEHAEPGRWVRTVPPRPAWLAREEGFRPQIVPVRTAERRIGSLIVVHKAAKRPVPLSEERLLAATAAQIATAIERDRLRRAATEAEALRRADELKSALLNAVSHDLRTPLASIIASAGSLQQTDVAWTGQERQEFAEAIEEEAQRLNRLVGNLLDLSRIESGSLRPQKGWYDLGALIDEVVGRLKPMTTAHKVSLKVDEDLPPVPLDYIEVDEVLTNLIENATKYTPPGTEIEVTACRAGEEVVVRVADRGPGLPSPEALDRVFQSFYRLNGSAARGTGLGLAVAKGLVEAHGGRIWAENREGGGAIFAFTLPLTSEGAATMAPAEAGP
jgi:two-component system, OmpR family, sensor histidine kinase KdpD